MHMIHSPRYAAQEACWFDLETSLTFHGNPPTAKFGQSETL